MKVEDLGDEPVFGPLMMHSNDEQLDLIFIGSGRVIESFGDIGELLVSEFEVNHYDQQ